MNKVIIYYLVDKGVPIYVGKTKNDLKVRERQHRLRLNNKNIIIHQVIETNEDNWKLWEESIIMGFSLAGFKLLNKNIGGGGLNFHTEESKLKMKGRKHPGTSIKLKGIKRPDNSIRMKGKKLSDQTIAKIVKAKTGHSCYENPERAEKIKISNAKHYLPNSERNKKISDKVKEYYKINN